MEDKNNKQQRKAYAKRGEGAQQKLIAFKLDKRLLAWLNSKPNKGRYLNNLIARDAKHAWVGDDEHATDLEDLGDYEE